MTEARQPSARWLVPEPAPEPELIARGLGRLRSRATQRSRLQLHDSFDWRLWSAGLVLLTRSGRPPALELHVAETLGSRPPLACWPDRSEPPAPSESWPPGELADRVRPLIGLRALRPVAELRRIATEHELKNADEKTVLRVTAESWHPRTGGPLHCCWRVEPLPGCEEEATAFARRLREAGFRPLEGAAVFAALEGLDRKPRTWSVRPDFRLAPEEPSRHAAVRMLRALLGLAAECEPGLRDDVDTEFLHDHRICLRRARSIVSELPEVLPAPVTRGLRDELRELGRATGRLRDLDVYLLGRERYQAMVPTEMRAGLRGLFAELAAERVAELRQVRRRLRTPEGASRVASLLSSLDEEGAWEPSPAAALPIGELARRLLDRADRRVRKDGRRLASETPDARVHRLRIDVKKLRYLLEHFASLLEPRALAGLLRQLKRLQDRLGAFNDYSVQGADLLARLDGRKGRAAPSPALAASVGALAGVLFREKQAARERLEKGFAAFDSEKTRELARGLFRPHGDAA